MLSFARPPLSGGSLRPVILHPRRLFASCLLFSTLLASAAAPTAFAAAHARGLAAVTPSRPTGSLGPLINIPQTWNNCGPASVAEVLAYWGISRTQGEVQAVLRADGNPH